MLRLASIILSLQSVSQLEQKVAYIKLKYHFKSVSLLQLIHVCNVFLCLNFFSASLLPARAAFRHLRAACLQLDTG